MSWQGTFLQVCYPCLQCEKFPPTEAAAPQIEDDTFHMDRYEYEEWVSAEQRKENWEIVCESTADSWVCPPCSTPRYTVTNYASRPKCRYCDFKQPNADEMWIAIAHNYALNPIMGPRPRANAIRDHDDRQLYGDSDGDCAKGWFSHAWFTSPDETINKAAFKKANRAAWTQVLANRAGQFQARVRCMSYDKVLLDIANEYPGESRAQHRLVLAQRARDFAELFDVARQACRSEAQKKAMDEASAHWHAQMKCEATDANFQAELATRFFAQHQLLQFLDDITETLAKYFVCRNPECRIYCAAIRWPTTCIFPPALIYDVAGILLDPQPHREPLTKKQIDNLGGHFRCPGCTDRYQPWIEGSKHKPRVPAQMIMVLHNQKFTTTAVLCEWASTVTQNLENELTRSRTTARSRTCRRSSPPSTS
jgi:hypothetical protein